MHTCVRAYKRVGAPPSTHLLRKCTCKESASAPLQAKIPDMDPLTMAWQFPPMGDIDKENPAAAFQSMAGRRRRRRRALL